MIQAIIEGVISAILHFIKEFIFDLIFDIIGRLYAYLENFKLYRFTPIIIYSRMALWTFAGLMCGMIIGFSGYKYLLAKASLYGTLVGLTASLLEYIIDFYKENYRPSTVTSKSSSKKIEVVERNRADL